MPDIRSVLNNKAEELYKEAVRLRRHFHLNPELSFKEFKTAAYICDYLNNLDIKYTSGITGTGIFAHVKGEKGKGPIIALRAELDALPITELTGAAYASKNHGVMHACGHDSHMAMLLSVLKLLNSIRNQLTGEFLFIFQPGEELAPGGASLIMKEGTLKKLNPDIIIAQHVLPDLESGKLGYRPGKYMASSDELYFKLRGKGGHSAIPDKSTDQVYIASQLVCRLKESAAKLPQLVLGIGRFIAEGATNVVPETVEITGTVRTFDEELRKEFHNTIISHCKNIAKESGIIIDPIIKPGYPVLVNDRTGTEKALKVSRSFFGEANVKELQQRMSSEDFSFYSSDFPVVFYRLGIKTHDEKGGLHTPGFDINEPAMITGITNMCLLALTFSGNI